MTSEQRADSDPTVTLASRADAAVLEVWDGERLKATVIASPADPYTVTNAALVATLGAETDLTIRAYLALGGHRGLDYDSVTVSKVRAPSPRAA